MAVIRELLQEIKKDLEVYSKNDPAIEDKWDIFFSVSFRGLVWYRIYHKLYQRDHKLIAKYLYFRTRLKYQMDIHPKAEIEGGVMIDHGNGVVIGSTAFVGSGTIIYHGVTLGSRRIMSGKRHPTICRNCFIGNHASILGNINIGNNVKIGANCVVLTDIPDNSTVVGIPGRILKP